MQETKTEHFTIRKIAPGILGNEVHDRVNVAEKDFWVLKNLNEEISQGKPYSVLITVGYFSKVSDQFKALSANKENTPYCYARAIVITSLGHRIMANFYLNFNQPQIPTRLFTSHDKAVKWLQKMKVNRLDLERA